MWYFQTEEKLLNLGQAIKIVLEPAPESQGDETMWQVTAHFAPKFSAPRAKGNSILAPLPSFAPNTETLFISPKKEEARQVFEEIGRNLVPVSVSYELVDEG